MKCSPKSSPHYYCINYYAVFQQKWQPPVEAVWAAIRFELFHEAHRNRNERERKSSREHWRCRGKQKSTQIMFLLLLIDAPGAELPWVDIWEHEMAKSWEFPKLTISLSILLLSTGCRLSHEYNTNSLLSVLPQLNCSWLLDWTP